MEQQSDLAEFSDLVGAIYDCALDPGRWPETLGAICRRIGFVNAVLAVQPLPSGPALLSATSGIAPEFLVTLPEFGGDAVRQWGGPEAALARPVGEPLVLSEINPAACAPGRDDRYYREWRAPQGLVDTLNITLLREPGLIGVASFGRHRDAGLIGPREVELARLLIPHLRRATAISHMLDAHAIEAANLAAVLDSLTIPIAIVGGSLELLHANKAAQESLAAGRVVRTGDGVLVAATPRITAHLREAVRHAVADEQGLGAVAPVIGGIGADGTAHTFHVLPLHRTALRRGMLPSAAAAIFMRPAAPDPAAPLAALAHLFDLTPSEARVFELIAGGSTPAEAAATLAVQPSTIKSHLLHLFDKLGVHRQAELVALAASFRLPVRDREPD